MAHPFEFWPVPPTVTLCLDDGRAIVNAGSPEEARLRAAGWHLVDEVVPEDVEAQTADLERENKALRARLAPGRAARK